MHYGIIDLTAADIDLLTERLRATARRVSKSAEDATSVDERMFYTNAHSLLQSEVDLATALIPGKHGFSEERINRMRSVLVEERHGDLARRYVQAKQNCDSDLPSLELEYLTWTSLREKLEKPFRDDRSQDAEPDEDDG